MGSEFKSFTYFLMQELGMSVSRTFSCCSFSIVLLGVFPWLQAENKLKTVSLSAEWVDSN